ncbi:hypothetical protein FDP41_010430 [Naegleria fowleri]|uniref:RGS domain-containing protein n=1 Tax=Naegleria fowleri TaxID=5763 RepID=A0A6A5CDD7_NAEFO|nr:uncharacterized protein FDP41_010430 [Naegleria fowleri]KAF0983365.1 hypothetical protein FDP41_010430 [Naegleria fowleri]CAG4718372.1 unnamed protein product [Naegleria fowleri]
MTDPTSETTTLTTNDTALKSHHHLPIKHTPSSSNIADLQSPNDMLSYLLDDDEDDGLDSMHHGTFQTAAVDSQITTCVGHSNHFATSLPSHVNSSLQSSSATSPTCLKISISQQQQIHGKDRRQMNLSSSLLGIDPNESSSSSFSADSCKLSPSSLALGNNHPQHVDTSFLTASSSLGGLSNHSSASSTTMNSTTSTSKAANRQSGNFDPINYMVIYEEAIKDKELRRVFCDFLKKCHVEEPILFMNSLDQYRTDYEKSLKDLGGWTGGVPHTPSTSRSSLASQNALLVSTALEVFSRNSISERSDNNFTGGDIALSPTSANSAFDMMVTALQLSNATLQSSSLYGQTVKNMNNIKLMKKHIKHLFELSKNMVQTFLTIGCEKELNLGATQKQILDRWELLCENYDLISNVDGFSDVSSNSDASVSSAVSSPSTASAGSYLSNSKLGCLPAFLNTILLQLEPDYIFGQVLFSVNLDLKLDQFPRFVRSDMLYKFLKEKGVKYTRSIAVDISKGYKVDLRFKPQDLKNKIITDDYIYFGFTLAEDTPDWQCILNKDKPYLTQAYISKTSYSFDESMKGMKLAKIVVHIPHPLEVIWGCYCNADFSKKFDKMANTKHEMYKFVPGCRQPTGVGSSQCPYNPDKPPYSLQFASNSLNLLPLLKKRQVPYVYTAIKDPIGMYMFLAHSAEFDDNEIPHHKGEVQGKGLFYYMFYKVNENLTRIVHVVYSDMMLPINPDLMLKMIFKKRAKEHYTGFERILNELSENGTKPIDTSKFVDGQNTKKCCEENCKLYPGRSWYYEWSSLRPTYEYSNNNNQ